MLKKSLKQICSEEFESYKKFYKTDFYYKYGQKIEFQHFWGNLLDNHANVLKVFCTNPD